MLPCRNTAAPRCARLAGWASFDQSQQAALWPRRQAASSCPAANPATKNAALRAGRTWGLFNRFSPTGAVFVRGGAIRAALGPALLCAVLAPIHPRCRRGNGDVRAAESPDPGRNQGVSRRAPSNSKSGHAPAKCCAANRPAAIRRAWRRTTDDWPGRARPRTAPELAGPRSGVSAFRRRGTRHGMWHRWAVLPDA